jgi:glycosyltransferase involved in cell wall biosynthesis
MHHYRVLLVTNMWPNPDDPSYGCFVYAQMESLRSAGVEYDVLFINGRESRWNYARAINQFRRKLQMARYDLIHAHFGLSGCIARCQFSVPVVVTFHGDDVMGQPTRTGSITPVGRLYQVSSFILARFVSASIVQSRQMQAKLGVAFAKIIPCGVDLELFRPIDPSDARRALGLDPAKKYILFPYDPAVKRKRYDLINAAVERAGHEVPDIEILHVHGVAQDRVPLYMNAADVLVLASVVEGSPNSVKEAMAVNLPVIAVDVGDTVELIDSTEGNYIVPRTVEAIQAKLIEVLKRGGRTCSRGCIERLSIEHIAERIVEVYADVVRKQPCCPKASDP